MMALLVEFVRPAICLSSAGDRDLVSQAVLVLLLRYLHALALTFWVSWVLILPATHLCVVDRVVSLARSLWYRFRYVVLSLYLVKTW